MGQFSYIQRGQFSWNAGGLTSNVWGQFSWNAGDSPLGKGICVGDSSLRMQGDRPLMYGDSSFIFKGDSSLETRDNVFHI